MASRPVSASIVRPILLGAAPAVLFAANFLFGAYLPIPSLVLVALAALGLATACAFPSVRNDLGSLRSIWPAGVMFAITIGVALWSLTPWVPDGPHPLWAWAGLPGAATLNTSATILEIIRLCGLACFFTIGCILGVASDRARETIRIILILGAVYAGLSLVSFLTGAQLGHRTGRLLGGFYSPNTAGTLLGVLTLLSIAWILHRWRKSEGAKQADRIAVLAPLIAIGAVLIATLLLTASRAAIGATALALVILLLTEAIANRRSRLPLLLAGAGLLASIGAFAVLGNSLILDRFNAMDLARDDRMVIFQSHWRAFLASPLMGYGLGTYPEVNNMVMTADTFGPLSATIVLHNSYLQWLEEAGVIGATPMFLLIAWIVGCTLWRTIGNSRNLTLLIGLLLATMVVLIHAAVDVSLHIPTFAAFWALLLGLGFALSQARSRRRRS
ncbi:hypothetical protein BH10PSE2_BH10PSE2_09960 [soil metagenome]